jgi:threonine/homoserine/homoserine lactone efflux protein
MRVTRYNRRVSVALDFIFGSVIGLSLSTWPGDGLSRAVRGAVRGGVGGGLAACGGGVAADLCGALLVGTILLSALLSESQGSTAVAIAGVVSGLVLAVLGLRLMEDRTAGALHREREGDHLRAFARNPFLDRFIATLLSLRWILLWGLAGAGILSGPAGRGWPGIAAFAAGLTLSGLLFGSIVVARLAAPGREWALSDRTFRILTALAGLGVVGMGVLVLLDAVRMFSLVDSLVRIVEVVFG